MFILGASETRCAQCSQVERRSWFLHTTRERDRNLMLVTHLFSLQHSQTNQPNPIVQISAMRQTIKFRQPHQLRPEKGNYLSIPRTFGLSCINLTPLMFQVGHLCGRTGAGFFDHALKLCHKTHECPLLPASFFTNPQCDAPRPSTPNCLFHAGPSNNCCCPP